MEGNYRQDGERNGEKANWVLYIQYIMREKVGQEKKKERSEGKKERKKKNETMRKSKKNKNEKDE